MKKTLLILPVLLMAGFLSRAQFKKGDVLLGGQLSYSSNENTYPNNIPPNTNYKSTNGNFAISAGKALSEHSVFGLTFAYTPTTQTNYYTGSGIPQDFSSDGFSAGIFYRTYKPLGKEFYFFGEANGAYQWANSSTKDNAGNKTFSGTTTGGRITAYPGISYKISKVFLLELSIPNLFTVAYSSGDNPMSNPSKTKNFAISTSLSTNPLDALGIGFRVIL